MGKLDKEHLSQGIEREEKIIISLIKKWKKSIANIFKKELDKKKKIRDNG